MAIEWSKDINFLGFFKRKDLPLKKDGYPTKTYINLVIPDEREEVGRRGLITAIVALVVLLIFGKFGVYDFFARVMAKNNELVEANAELHDYTLQLTDYEEVLNTYNSYEAVRMTSDAVDVALVDVLELIDNHVSTVAEVNSVSMGDNQLTLKLTGISLDEVSDLVNDLNRQPIVEKAVVTDAYKINSLNNEEKGDRTVTLIATLQSTAAAAAKEAAEEATIKH